MKRLTILSTLLLLIVWSLRAENVVGNFGVFVQPYTATYNYHSSLPIDIQVEGFSLVADSGSLKEDIAISLSVIPYKGGYTMPSNMENVCLLNDGVRLLPNGEHFSESNPALISLAYDPNRIPRGYNPNDIYTFYSDGESNWHRLERVSIDTSAHTIKSYTTHFTDFANAVIKIPEMPESKAYVPTAMNDLPDVDPMHGIPMIKAPTANNKGTAELIYPIVLPEGRHGMQPNVDLHYSSSGSNGILGVGWSISTPAITIDTRWGVPIYDPNNESEQYLVNGAPILLRRENGTAIALPYQNNAYTPRSKGITNFSARDTKNQDKIDRIGTNPTDYWWAVTDRNGITTYYGRTFDPAQPQNETIDESSVVRTTDNCIAYWAATASVDVYGNYIRYINEKSGNTIYLRQIDYTGNCIQNVQPTYRVHLGYQGRTDLSTSGRLGVLQTEDSLLCHLLVQYHNPNKSEPAYTDNLAAYYMQYTQPSEATLYKTRLAEVIMLDSVHDLMLNSICDIEEVLTGHVLRDSLFMDWIAEAEQNGDLEYSQQIMTILHEMYGQYSIPGSVTQFLYADAPAANNLFGAESIISNSEGRDLSANHSSSWGLGGTATVGFGPDVATTLLSFGGNYNFSRSKGGCTSMLLDMNGDGLMDIVYEQNGIVFYCKQEKQGNGYSFANAVQLHGLTRLSREVTNTHTWGLQLSFGADLSYTNPIATSYTDTYFSDVNADGLPDMIDGDKILINHLTSNGTPSFEEFTGVNHQTITVHNSYCSNSIILDGEVDEHIECEVREIPLASYSLEDYFGQQETYGFGAEQVKDEEIDYPELHITNEDLIPISQNDQILNDIDFLTSVHPTIPPIGHAKKRNRDGVISPNDSLIYRIEGDSVKVYRLEYICEPLKADPEIETVRVWAAPQTGTVILTDSIALVADFSESRLRSRTADGVAYTIQLCQSVSQTDSMHLHADNYILLHQGVIGANDTLVHPWSDSIAVLQGDILMFRLRSGDNNRFDKTVWTHHLRYADNGPVYDSQRDYICTGEGYFQANDTGSVSISFSGSNDGIEPVVLRVRKNKQLSAYLLDTTFYQGSVDFTSATFPIAKHDSLIISLSSSSAGSQEPLWSDIHIIPQLQYISDFPGNGSQNSLIHDTIDYNPDVRIACSSAYSASSPYRKLFGPMHKGWGAFAYHNIDNRDTILLDLLVNMQRLVASQLPADSSLQSYQPNIPSLEQTDEDVLITQVGSAFSNSDTYNPVSEDNYWVPMRADSRTEQWIAYGNMGCIDKKQHSNAREITMQQTVEEIVEYDSSLPFHEGETRVNNFVRKQSRSVQHCISLGAIIVNASVSFGSYDAIVDYMDMNGDGFPDFIGKGGIQYSKPWGGIGQLKAIPNYSPFKSKNNACGVAFSGCSALLEKTSGNSIKDGKYHLNASMGASASSGQSSTKIQFMDVNADGLPDKIEVDNNQVYYNLGYGFSGPHAFTCNVSKGSSVSLNANLSPSFSIGQISISGGMGGSLSTNTTNELLIDINGDGLPDKIQQIGTDSARVAYNKGNQNFEPWKAFINQPFGQDTTIGFSTTLGVTGGFSIMEIVKINLGIQASPYNTSSSHGSAMLSDMDGDGLVDYVYKDSNGLVHVRHNTTGQANLLKTVVNPTGQRIQLDYSLSEPSSSHRSRQWNLSRVVNRAPDHPMEEAESDTVEIRYTNAYYDNFERTDFGYEYVRTIENSTKVNKLAYQNQSFMQIGELKADSLMDTDGNMYISHIHENRYRNIATNEEMKTGDPICDDANVLVLEDGYWTDYYEKESTPQITTRYNIQYDHYHNIVEYLNEGDISTPDDDWRQEISYMQNTANNMISLPQTEKIYNNANQLLRSSSAYYSYYGYPAHIQFEDAQLNTAAMTHLAYDNFGNISAIIAPQDANNEYNWSMFTYDSVTYSNVIKIDNPFHAITSTEYDYRWGLPKRIIDPAEDTMKYIYDYKGRLEKVIAPLELQKKKDYTVKYTYNLIRHNLKTEPSYLYTHVYKDMYDSLFVQREVSLHDQYGRIIQKKHYAEIGGSDGWVVDGAEEWDSFGRVIVYEYPFESNSLPHEYLPVNYSRPSVHTSYDLLDRPTLQTNADGTKRRMFYHFKDDSTHIKRFLTKTTDENGIVTSILKSPQDRQIQQQAGDSSITFFEYSPLGELLRVTDADGYRTVYSYDMYGNVLSRVHPDAGETTMIYDLAGNMTRKQTANLALTHDSVEYVYKYSRLKEIHYPIHPENNVSYTYDRAGRIAIRQDGVGSEEFIYDQMGNVAQSIRRIVIPTETNAYIFRTLYKYDSFGRMRNIIYPDGEVVHYGYTTGGLLKNVVGQKHGEDRIYLWDRLYDAQGRKQYQLYGNGVWTEYSYSSRQWLDIMHTELPYNVELQDLHYTYDSIGNVILVEQTANALSNPTMGGAYTNDYSYDLQYRLHKSNGYGNFPYYTDCAFSAAGRMGEKFTDNNPFETSLLFSYNQEHMTHQPRTALDMNQGPIEFYWDANGNLAQIIGCQQNAMRLHEWDEENRLRFVLGETKAGYYGYDANGERVYKLTGISIIDQVNAGQTSAHAVLDNAVLYPNPYMVVTPNGYTKHYYAGTERLATVIGSGGLDDMMHPLNSLTIHEKQNIVNAFHTYYSNYDPFNYNNDYIQSKLPTVVDLAGNDLTELQYQCTPLYLWTVDIHPNEDILLSTIENGFVENGEESDFYYYHGDHLGSANWITGSKGDAIQYIHYAPFGELLANIAPYGYDERYKFTGKERDTETGYDFFGARYLSSVLGHWLSVDPLADKYPNISPYAYCGWNPIGFVDLDGREKNVFLHPLMDETLRKGANNYKDNVPSIHIWAHGSSNSIQFYNEATDETIMANSVEKVLNFLNKFVFPESDAWQKHLTEGTQAVIVLHACETGKGENSIAQQLSAQLPKTIVIAPNENVAVDKTTNKELGTYKTRTVTNEKGENVLTTVGVGAWTIFREGNPIVSFDGSTKPNASKPENFHIEGL